MKHHVMWKAVCQCGWTTGYVESASKAQKAMKQHLDNDPHRDYVDVPLI